MIIKRDGILKIINILKKKKKKKSVVKIENYNF
jgi:hypothetical protein